ncbi:RES domain-containing protein [Streptomyces paludis]|uniref:RES domain-containing protein n=1 Tax=Streptomyces paludis TaxID=2282738 RepID=A0A345I1G4_9ACTN|nr:RES domain-containing protein [Streptomyces paludis]
MGKRDCPVKYNCLEPETALGNAAGRFSLFTYGTLYCATAHIGCYAEGLRTFRVSPKMRGLLTEDPSGRRAMANGHLPSGWREDHILVRLLPGAGTRFLDVDAESTREFLSKELQVELADLGVSGLLTEEHVYGPDRRVARQIAAWAVAQRDREGHRLVQGIAYRSDYGGHRCWAVLSDVDLVEAERCPIRAEDVELRSVAVEYGLTIR